MQRSLQNLKGPVHLGLFLSGKFPKFLPQKTGRRPLLVVFSVLRARATGKYSWKHFSRQALFFPSRVPGREEGDSLGWKERKSHPQWMEWVTAATGSGWSALSPKSARGFRAGSKQGTEGGRPVRPPPARPFAVAAADRNRGVFALPRPKTTEYSRNTNEGNSNTAIKH